MKNIRKALSLVLALAMALSLSVSVMAEGEDYPAVTKTLSDIAEDLTGKTVILHTNDVHGVIEYYEYIAALRDELEGRGAEVILADAGDFSQDTTYVGASKGATAVQMMNAAGYDVAALGNHEFDYGTEAVVANIEAAEFKIISANILKDGKSLTDPTYIYETKSGVKIGFFGLETPETATKTHPGKTAGLMFLSNTNGTTALDDCAKQQVADLQSAGVDLIIGLWHLGVADESAQDGHRSIDVLSKLDGVDFVIDGHSHTVMTEGESGKTIVQSTGTKFNNIGVVVIDDASKKIEANCLIPLKDADGNIVLGLDGDKAVAEVAAKIKTEVDEEYGVVVGTSEVKLNGDRAPGNRTEETNNGDLITDAMVWTVLNGDVKLTVDADHVVAIQNGGGVRKAIEAGTVTKMNVHDVMPYFNTVSVVYITGAELLEALEASTQSTPNEIGGYPQTAGIKFTVDTTKAYDKADETYPDGSTYYGPKSIQRVTIESINGKDFDEKATYAVVTNDFTAFGGDTYYVFKNASAAFDTFISLDDAVVDYIQKELNGVITAEKYGQPRGDQTIKVDVLAKYTDVNTAAWYAPALRYAIENSIQTGTSDTEFSPDLTLTRAQVIKTIANMAGEDTTPAEGEKWYDKAVAWAVENEISDGQDPDGASTREDFVAMLYSYLKTQGKGFEGEWEFTLDFPDADQVSESASEAMHWMVMNGGISGMAMSSDVLMLNPQGTVTRAQFAQVLLNLSTAD